MKKKYSNAHHLVYVLTGEPTNNTFFNIRISNDTTINRKFRLVDSFSIF